MIFFEYLILFFSLAGFGVAYYIYKTNKENRVLVCPLKADCEAVVKSPFSRFLGIKVEVLGIIYYIFIFLAYLFYFIYNSKILILDFVLFKISFLAFLFSLYLTLIQIFKLRKFCSWCLVSAFLSFLIFGISYNIYKSSIEIIALQFRWFSVFGHALFSGIGLGVVLVVDYLFFKFLKDKKIDDSERKILDYLSDLIWLILAFVFLTGSFIYFSDMAKYHQSLKFQFKMIVFLVIIINGIVLNLFVSPKIANLDFSKLSYKEFFAIFSGVVSFISWFLAFILGRLNFLPLNLSFWILIYFGFLIFIFLIFFILFRFIKNNN